MVKHVSNLKIAKGTPNVSFIGDIWSILLRKSDANDQERAKLPCIKYCTIAIHLKAIV